MQFDTGGKSAYKKVQPPITDIPISSNLSEVLLFIRAAFQNSDDLVIQSHTAGKTNIAIIMFEGLISNAQVSQYLLEPLCNMPSTVTTSAQVLDYIRNSMMPASDQKEARTYAEIMKYAMSGFAVVVIDGEDSAVVLGYQGFTMRSVSEPSAETNLKGSREGFVEAIVPNVSLVRRRLKTPMLTVESTSVGTVSNTAVKMLYLRDTASPKMVAEVRERLKGIKIDVLLSSSYLIPFLGSGRFSLFSGVSTTERPDTLCAKLSEGRIGILIDGTPFALILPHLFIEHFQTMDDYIYRPYFATFIRILKLASFFFTIFLPGYYVAVVTFHPQLIPDVLLDSFIGSVAYTPLPAIAEAILVFVLYELLREAGLRLPRPIGHAISIVGGLVIGDAAVSAGLVGLPMVILIGITAISSFVIPQLYEPITILRFGFIIIGGIFGLFGIYLGLGLLLVNLCSLRVLGIPVTSPISPFDATSLRDMAVRSSWKTLRKKTLDVSDIPGSEL